MRIAGVLIPVEKPLGIALTYVYGLGLHRATELCKAVKLDPTMRTKELTTEQQDALRSALESLGYIVEADLRRQISQDIKRLQDIGCYRGFRHRRRLPLRGQRTKTNARTRKGRKGAAVAKKKVAAK